MYIERELEKELKKYLDCKEILAVLGSRQCGKTTMVENILSDLEKKGKKISKVSFDEVHKMKLFEEDIDLFIEEYIKGFDYLFIDEVQYSKDSGKKLKYIFDKEKIKIIITGSSTTELSIQSIKHLVGRIFIFNLYPFSFEEFLKSKDEKLVKILNKDYKEAMTKKINKFLEEFIIYGGYPRVVLSKTNQEKEKVLENIYSTYLLKEVKELISLSDDYKLINLTKYLALQTGNLINYEELSKLTGFKFIELKKMLNILEKTHLIKLVKPFFKNKRNEITKAPKIFFIDNGFRNTAIKNYSKERTDQGRLLENFVFTEITKNNLEPKYWRTKNGTEIDFIIEHNEELLPIEVKTNTTIEKTQQGIKTFNQTYNTKKAIILSLETQGQKNIEERKIFYEKIQQTKRALNLN